jgi:hypothetical protein
LTELPIKLHIKVVLYFRFRNYPSSYERNSVSGLGLSYTPPPLSGALGRARHSASAFLELYSIARGGAQVLGGLGVCSLSRAQRRELRLRTNAAHSAALLDQGTPRTAAKGYLRWERGVTGTSARRRRRVVLLCGCGTLACSRRLRTPSALTFRHLPSHELLPPQRQSSVAAVRGAPWSRSAGA